MRWPCIDTAGVPSAVLVADVYNLMAGVSTVESMHRYGERIGMIHVNDAPHRRFDELDVMYTRLFPGDGILDPAEWVRSARAGGFKGPVSLEIFRKDIWEMTAAEAMDFCAGNIRRFEETL
jgi:sugar phosphate isomerase/epimerase